MEERKASWQCGYVGDGAIAQLESWDDDNCTYKALVVVHTTVNNLLRPRLFFLSVVNVRIR